MRNMPGTNILHAYLLCNVCMCSVEKCILYAVCSLVKYKPLKRGRQQIQSNLIVCPPPRKSLVKGERFIRSEGRPEGNAQCLGVFLMRALLKTVVGSNEKNSF